MNLSILYLSAVEELCLFAFCCTCERILQEPRVGIYTYSKTRVMSFHATSLTCVVLLDFLMLFILFGVKIKESFSIICHLCDLCVVTRLVENERLDPFPVCRSSSAAHHVTIKGHVSFFFSSPRRWFFFLSECKINQSCNKGKGHTLAVFFFYWRKKKSAFFFPFTHSMLLQFQEINKIELQQTS